ncbi:UNVERIFIED_CONTAM: hypothetical protein NCL1_19623 [Trichonephila clavipes]
MDLFIIQELPKSTMKYLSTYEQGLSPELKQKAKEELGETPEKKAQSLKELRRLINGQKLLKKSFRYFVREIRLNLIEYPLV